MRTTIDLNDAKLAELKELARKSKRSFRSVVDEIPGLGLAAAQPPSKKQSKVRLKTHKLDLKPGFRGVSANELCDQLEAEG